MMNDMAIQKIVDIAQPTTHEIDGRRLSSRPLFNPPRPEEPNYPTIQVATLTGLVDIAEERAKDPIVDKGLAISVNAQSVSLIGGEFGINRQRPIYAQASCSCKPFTFENYLDLERFRVEILVRIEADEQRDLLLEFISRITDENIKTLTDNGVAQTLEGRVGIASFGQVKVPSPLPLCPIRTFREVVQPEGLFIFRMRKGASGPEAALHEIFTDWQRSAVLNIRDYLRGQIGIPGTTIPIYA